MIEKCLIYAWKASKMVNKSLLKILHDFADGKDIIKETHKLIELSRRYMTNFGNDKLTKISNGGTMVS